MRTKLSTETITVNKHKFEVAKVKVGDRFVHTMSLPWTDGKKKGTHFIKRLVEVTKVHGTNADFKTVKTIEEHGAPSFKRDFAGGGFSRIYLNDNRKFEKAD